MGTTALRSWQGRLLTVAAAAIVVAAVAGVRWFSATPQISNSCSGVVHSSAGPRPEGVEEIRTFRGNETVIPYADGEPVTLFLCLAVEPGVRVDAVRLRTPPRSLLEPGDPGVIELGDAGGRPFVPRSSTGQPFMLGLVMRFANCDVWTAGTGLSFSDLEVTYEYRGRTRTATVGLSVNGGYRVESPPNERCPARA
jgi:hypothetical protein